jgi:hypothetical protein
MGIGRARAFRAAGLSDRWRLLAPAQSFPGMQLLKPLPRRRQDGSMSTTISSRRF